MSFMNKSLKKAHMKRSRLRNIYLKSKTDTSRIAYIKQRNYCVSLLRKTKKISLREFTRKKMLLIINNSEGHLNRYYQIR